MLIYHIGIPSKKLRGSLGLKGSFDRIVWSDDSSSYSHMLVIEPRVILVGEIALSLV